MWKLKGAIQGALRKQRSYVIRAKTEFLGIREVSLKAGALKIYFSLELILNRRGNSQKL